MMKHGLPRLFDRRKLVVIAVALATAAASTACSSSKQSGTGGSSAQGQQTTTQSQQNTPTVAAAAADLAKYTMPVNDFPTVAAIPGGVGSLRGKTIWYIPLGQAVPLIAAVGSGMQGAFQAAGVNYHVCDGGLVPTSQASCLSQAVTQHAAAVVTGYVDYNTVGTAIDNVVSQGIPVLVGGEPVPNGKTNSSRLAFADTLDLVNIQQKLNLEQVIVDSSGKAKILFLGITDSPETAAGAAYAKSFVAQACPGCTFNEVDYATASLNKVPSLVSAALIRRPDTTYVANENDSASQFTLQGIQSAGFSGKAKLAAAGASLDSLQRIRSAQVESVDTGFSKVVLGWEFADSVFHMLLGQIPPTSRVNVVRTFTEGNVKSLTLTPAAYATNSWYGSGAFEQKFATAWGVHVK